MHSHSKSDSESSMPLEQPLGGIGKALQIFEDAMKKCGHMLYRGKVMKRIKGAKMTYRIYKSVPEYIQILLANRLFRSQIAQHSERLITMFGNPHCALVPQLEMDMNTIEVMDGVFFRFDERGFSKIPPSSKRTQVSPCAYFNYDSTKRPKADIFVQSWDNSFGHDQIQSVRAMNKFYQCFMANKMQHKTRKLVLYGPKDSGKTTWIEILKGVISESDVAFVGQDHNFPLSMLTDHTRLIIMDDWSNMEMMVDTVKQLFQGGLIAVAEKYKNVRTLTVRCPIIVTTNVLPDFGQHQDAVQRRMYICYTKSMPEVKAGLHSWYRKNAMHCIAYMAEKLNNYDFYIEKDELFYREQDIAVEVDEEEVDDLEDFEMLRQINSYTLTSTPLPSSDPSDFHASFRTLPTDLSITLNEAPRMETSLCSEFMSTSDIQSDQNRSAHWNDWEDSAVRLVLNELISSVCKLQLDDNFDFVVETPKKRTHNETVDYAAKRLIDNDTKHYKREFLLTEMNSSEYFNAVYCHLLHLSTNASYVHYFSFIQRLEKFPKNYMRPNVELDAWKLVQKRPRDVFRQEAFLKLYPESKSISDCVRTNCRIVVGNGKTLGEELGYM